MAVALAMAAFVVIWFLVRDWNLFFYDEWGTILYRRTGGLDALLPPHNGHLQAVVIAVYRLLFATAGLEDYWPYRAVELLAHVTLGAMVFLFARPRVGTVLGLCGACLVLFVSAGYETIFWLTMLGFVVPLIALVVILGTWSREGAAWSALRTVALLAALASSGVGVAVAAGVGVLWLLGEARTVRRLAEIGGPVLLYAAWYLVYKPSANPPAELVGLPGADPRGDLGIDHASASIGDVPSYVLHSAEAAANGVLGLDPRGGVVVLAILVAGGGVAVWRRAAWQPPVVAALASTLVVFWVLLAVARGGAEQPTLSHYLYIAAVLIVLLAAELLAGHRLPLVLTAALVAGTALVVRADLSGLHRIGQSAGPRFDELRVELRQLAGQEGRRPPSYEPDPAGLPGVRLGPYLAAVRDLGYPAGTRPGR